MIQIFLADGTDGTDERTDQLKVVQEVLADLKKGAGRYFISKHCDALELLEIDSDHCKRMFANQLTKL